jgi:hypothetical protein
LAFPLLECAFFGASGACLGSGVCGLPLGLSVGVGPQTWVAAGSGSRCPPLRDAPCCLLSPGGCLLGWLLRACVCDFYPRWLSGVLVRPASGLWVPWSALLGSCHVACSPASVRWVFWHSLLLAGFVWCVHPWGIVSCQSRHGVDHLGSPVHMMLCCCGILSAALDACMCFALHGLHGVLHVCQCVHVGLCCTPVVVVCICLHASLHLLHSTCISPLCRRHQYLGTASAVSFYLLGSCPLGGLNAWGLLVCVMCVGALLLLHRYPPGCPCNPPPPPVSPLPGSF